MSQFPNIERDFQMLAWLNLYKLDKMKFIKPYC
jgi:hypothetical protein